VGAIAAPVANAQQKVLRAVMHADVRTLDPIWTTQTIAGIHAMLVYDTLFGNDDDLVPQPQMVGKYEISEDKLTYTFTLRDGVKFHDGSPVASKDVIPSLKRWAARDNVGQRLFSFVDRLEAVDDKTFRMILTKPYGMVLESLGKSGTSVAVIMREQEALTDPQQQIKEAIGSGPFKFAKDEWVPGSKTVYLKNADYVTRPGAEKASSFAGSKFAGVDRIELIWIADPQTTMSALINGEIDFWENPNIDFLPLLEKAKGVKLLKTGKYGTNAGFIRLNHLHPPFNNVKARQAMYHLINQEDFLRAIVGDPKYYRVCHGLLTCGGPYENDGGTAFMKEYNPKKALQLLKEAGYKGEPITVLATTDHNTITPATQVLIQAMREAGINVDAQSMDWGSVVSRRAKKEPPAQGGWNIFHTWTTAFDIVNPAVNAFINSSGDKAWFGWPTSEAMEKLRTDWAREPDQAKQKKMAEQIQLLAYDEVPHVSWGQFIAPSAFRKNVKGVLEFGATILWNIQV
jgi:peptide/nickel transport system substrate-binding protein